MNLIKFALLIEKTNAYRIDFETITYELLFNLPKATKK